MNFLKLCKWENYCNTKKKYYTRIKVQNSKVHYSTVQYSTVIYSKKEKKMSLIN